MRTPTIALAALLVSTQVHAQVLSFPSPVPAGTNLPITLTNDTGAPMFFGVGSTVAVMLQPTGERIAPDVFYQSDAIIFIPVGGTTTGSLDIPASGSGSQGSFVLFTPLGNGAVKRLDVGSPSSSFPAIHVFPRFVATGHGAHLDGFSQGGATWRLANSSASSHTFGPGDRLDVMVTGTTTVLATTSLTGITVPSEKVGQVTLPTNALPPGPYTVQVSWNDPLVGPSIQRDGIRTTTGVDMHFASGKSIPLGGNLDVDLFFHPFDNAPLFAFLVGFQPGSITLPGGAILPLVGDPLVIQSFGGLGGLLTNGAGTATQVFPCFCVPQFWAHWNVQLAHPGAIASGLTLRAATLAIDPVTGILGVSQPEDFLLQ